ncbi:MAG TPA: isoprenylcysteine carboxylmethyltransferase family protein [Methylomirabilota bacterium]|nr:isoprenylcysteine carboxylmethyltransferase family protein [Methylomirabilota bacterium]
MSATGDVLFRWRSWLPLLLLPIFLATFTGASYPRGSHRLDLLWEGSCLLVSVMGMAVRVFTAGTAPRGTSGRNTRAQKAALLSTTGAYSLVRHPLYLGNFLIALGMSLFSRTWFLPLIVSLAALLYYERIAAREEQFLDAQFGEAFRAWAARVPAVVPHLRGWQPPALPFSWARALDREFYAIAEIAVAFFVLDILEDWSVEHRFELDPVWTTVAIAGALFFAVMWSRKKLGRRASR